MAKIELNNKTDKKFIDISTEEFRTYYWSGGSSVTINDPQWLSIGETGHRVLDLLGISHYIPYGWIHLNWKARQGEAHFVR